jgi:hypothetical protein
MKCGSILCLMVSASIAVLMGCDRESEDRAPAPAQQQPPTNVETKQKPPPVADRPTGSAQPTPMPTQKQPAPSESAPAPSDAFSRSPAPAQPQPPRTAAPSPAQPSQPPAQAALTPEAKARQLLDQLRVQKGEGKWADGEKTLQELEKLKRSLSNDLKDEIDSERASFRAAKAIWNQDR